MSVIITGNADPKEAQAYVDYLENKYNRKLDRLDTTSTASMPISITRSRTFLSKESDVSQDIL